MSKHDVFECAFQRGTGISMDSVIPWVVIQYHLGVLALA
jgi:hypothetical protein